jgi:hypothetical protein
MPQGAWGATGQGLGDAARAALLQGPVVCVRAGTWSSVSTCKITFQSEFNPTLNCSNVTNQLVSISLKLNVIYAGWGGSCQNETRLRSSAKHTHADEPHKRLNPPLEDYTRGISESIWKHLKALRSSKQGDTEHGEFSWILNEKWFFCSKHPCDVSRPEDANNWHRHEHGDDNEPARSLCFVRFLKHFET